MTDINGNIVWLAIYNSFGKADVQPSSTIINNLRFPGQYYDLETNLHYNWNRYYDPTSGRYLTTDPIGFFGWDVNLYRYVLNNPVNWADPEGEISAAAAGGIVIVGGIAIAVWAIHEWWTSPETQNTLKTRKARNDPNLTYEEYIELCESDNYEESFERSLKKGKAMTEILYYGEPWVPQPNLPKTPLPTTPLNPVSNK